MIERLRQRVRRLLGFVELLKRHRYPNAESYARRLARLDREQATGLTASVRTVKRDIAYLRDVLDAPLNYDRAAGGYELIDPRWTFPLQSVGGAEAFPNLLVSGAGMALHPVFREAMYSPFSLLDPEGIEIQELVPLIVATHGTPPIEPEVVEAVLYAWRDRKVLDVDYTSPRRSRTRRSIEVHAVVAQEGIWYARAWCRLRCASRTFALHRIRAAALGEDTFTPRQEVLDELRGGNALGFATVEHVTVRCPAEYAPFYEEREWFAGQFDRRLPDGSLEMLFPAAPRPVLVSWVLYNAPELEVLAPEDVRAEIAAKAQHLVRTHRTEGVPGQVEKWLQNE